MFSNDSLIEYIGNWGFFHCISLELIIIPKSVKSIKGFTFYQCEKLKSVIFSNDSLVENI